MHKVPLDHRTSQVLSKETVWKSWSKSKRMSLALSSGVSLRPLRCATRSLLAGSGSKSRTGSKTSRRQKGIGTMSGWLDLKRAAEYCCLSVRTLRHYIGDPHH